MIKKKKILNKLGVKGRYPNITKAICDKFSSNIILNRENLKTFLLRSRIRQKSLLLPLLFNIVLEVLARTFRQGIQKEIKAPKSEREKKYLQLMVYYIEKILKTLLINTVRSNQLI